MARFLFPFILLSAAVAEAGQLTETESADGRIRAVLTVSPDRPRLSDTIRLTLDIQADATLRFEMPEFGDAIGDLRIVETAETLSEVTETGETRRLVLRIVPEHGGTAPLWPIVIRYADRREGVGQESSITLPATELDIRAEVTPETASLEKITAEANPFDIRTDRFWAAVVVAAVILAALAVLMLLLRRKKETVTVESMLSPQEIALERIVQLVGSRLHENDVKKFFIELTGIVRWYIERRTEIRAPELTTEEFLHEISRQWQRGDVLPPELRDRLRLFLESADMVKFAKFQPSQDEIMLGIRRAEEFVLKFDPRPEDEFAPFNAV